MDTRFPSPTLRFLLTSWAVLLLHTISPTSAQGADSSEPRAAPSARATPAGEAPTRAIEQPDAKGRANEYLARGLELYGRKHYTEAIAEFRAGYALDADLRLLYALAQSLRLAGRCDEATALYLRFLESTPTPAQEAAARANLDRCREQAASGTVESEQAPRLRSEQTEPTRPIELPPAQPPDGKRHMTKADEKRKAPSPHPSPPPRNEPPRNEPPHDEPPRVWYADPLGGALVGGGLLTAGAGVALLVAANADSKQLSKLEDGVTPGTYQRHEDRAESGTTKAVSGGALTAVGLSALVLGALRYHRVATERKLDIALTVRPSQTDITVEGSF